MFFKNRRTVKHFRLFKKHICVPNNIYLEIIGNCLIFICDNNKINLNFSYKIKIFQIGKFLFIKSNKNNKKWNCLVGIYYSTIINIINGFNKLFIKKLLLVGIGFKANLINNRFLYLYVGFSHPLVFKIPSFVFACVKSNVEIWLSGIDKQKVFQTAAFLRGLKKPDPYKGKGIRYLNEKLILKEIKKN